MKQILAISLLLLLSFNWFGYRLLSNFLQHNADQKLEAKLDKEEYDPSQLIELRIPIHLPYHNDWDHFERYDGEIVMNGIHYKYVKRKVEKGELVLLCLPNNDKQMLTSARDQFFQLVNDIQQNPTGKQSEKTNSTSVKNVLSDYHADNHHWGLSPFEIIPPLYASLNTEHFQSADLSSPEQPPESVQAI